MNILYLAHRIPYPPNKGDKLRAFRQIEQLSRNHRVWCACFVDDPRDMRNVIGLSQFCESLVTVELRPLLAKIRGLWSLFRGETITEGFYAIRKMSAVIDDWQRTVDFGAVVAFSSSMAPYVHGVSAKGRILDLCDLDSMKWSDYADHIALNKRSGLYGRLVGALYRAESSRLRAAELRWIDGFDAAILATEPEAASLRGLVPDCKLHVIGNGVEPPCEASPPSMNSHGSPTVGFVGVMDYFPNVDAVTWFAKECWPQILTEFPRAQFRIVGRNPTRSVRRLSQNPGIQVVGEVSNVGHELSRFDVSVAPLRIARGIQNKVLEAMAAGKPVVLTPNAAQGIAAQDCWDYVVADSPTEIVEAIASLLTDHALRNRIGASAREFVAQNRRWAPEMEKFDALVTGGTIASAPIDSFPMSVQQDPDWPVAQSASHAFESTEV